jgi:uncharacterized protein YrrD
MEELGKTFNTRELLKADVVELATGSVVGRVVEAIVNTRLGIVEYLGVRPMQWYRPGVLLKISDILGFDESVLLIRSESVFSPFDAKQHARNSITCSELYSLTLIDQVGHVLGNPVGAVFSPAGRILAIEAEKDLVVHIINLGRIIAVGDRFVVVDLMLRNEPPPANGANNADSSVAAKDAGASENKAQAAAEDDGANDNGGRDSLAAKYRERQMHFMLGKTSPLTLNGKNGSPIISLGETITGPVVNRLVDEGVLNEVFVALTVQRGRIPTDEPELKPE